MEQKNSCNSVTEYYYNGTQLIMESRDGQRIYYIYGQTGVEGMVLGYKTANNAYYFDKNTLGDIISIRNQEGQIVAEYEYDAWGRILYQSGEMSDINPFRYRGYYYDQETGFYYLQTRYYDPEAMRFINADNYELIAELAQSYELNLYAYCANNPVMFTDETGEFVVSCLFLLKTALVVAGIGASVKVGTTIYKDYKEDGIWFNKSAGEYFGNAIDGFLSGFGVGFCIALGAGYGAAMISGGGATLFSVTGITLTFSNTLAMGGSVAFSSGAMGYLMKSWITKEKISFKKMMREGGYDAISGMLSYAGAIFAGAAGLYNSKLLGVTMRGDWYKRIFMQNIFIIGFKLINTLIINNT